MNNDLFEEYDKAKEPDKQYKGYVWKTAIGLQQVDGLEPSEYLIKTARSNIDGDITFAEAKELINSYYESKPNRDDNRTEEADKVSARIAEILARELNLSFENDTKVEEVVKLQKQMKDEFDSQFGECTVNIIIGEN